MTFVIIFILVIIVFIILVYYIAVFLNATKMEHSKRSQFLFRSNYPWRNLFENWLKGEKPHNKEYKILSKKDEEQKLPLDE